MAKQQSGILDGYIGKVGTVVGYMWNGKYCTRAYVRNVKNPRTPAQVERRDIFRQEVQLAAKMRWAVATTMSDMAREVGLTAYNLFVHVNQPAFGSAEGRLTVDYGRLVLSMGDVLPVQVETMEWTADNVLSVRYDRGRGSGFDHVYLYVYVPDLETGFLAAPVYRRDKRIAVALPDEYAGHEAHVYLMVQSADGRWSDSLYAGAMTLNELVSTEEEPVQDLQAATSVAAPEAAPEAELQPARKRQPSPAADRPPDKSPESQGGMQYSLF